MGYIHEMFKAYIVNKAYKLAKEAHKGQKRRGTDKDYISHPADVVERLKLYYDKHDNLHHLVVVGYLHDVIEDTEVTIEDLKAKDFPEDTITAIDVLTKKKGQSYDDYLKGVKENDIAKKVKIQDMLSNLADRPSERQIKKYLKGLEYLLK